MSSTEKLKSFQEITKAALFRYFASTVDSAYREDIKLSQDVIDTQSNSYVTDYPYNHLGDFDVDDVVMSEAYEAQGIVYVTFTVERGELVYTFRFSQPNTLMNIIMKEVVAA